MHPRPEALPRSVPQALATTQPGTRPQLHHVGNGTAGQLVRTSSLTPNGQLRCSRLPGQRTNGTPKIKPVSKETATPAIPGAPIVAALSVVPRPGAEARGEKDAIRYIWDLLETGSRQDRSSPGFT